MRIFCFCSRSFLELLKVMEHLGLGENEFSLTFPLFSLQPHGDIQVGLLLCKVLILEIIVLCCVLLIC